MDCFFVIKCEVKDMATNAVPFEQRLRPFLYLGQSFTTDQAHMTKRPFLRSAYGLWHFVEGSAVIHRGEASCRIEPGMTLLTTPGDQVHLGRGARINVIIFDLVDRPRTRDPTDGRYTVPADPVQPSWESLFDQELPLCIPASWQAPSRMLVDHLRCGYWLDALHRIEANAQLALWAVRYARDLAAAQSGRNDPTPPDLILAAEAYIRQNYRHGIGIEDVARALGVSRPHLTREFRRRTQHTPGDLLRSVRLSEGLRLLETGDATVAAIAGMIGYRGAGTFIKAFHRWMGITPESHRRRLRMSGY